MDNAAFVIKERETQLVVSTALQCAGFDCSDANSTASLLRGLRRNDVRLIVLDIDDPHVDWREVLEWRRSWFNPSLVVILLGGGAARSAVQALEAGADDYVSKPLNGAELVARAKAALRKRGPSTELDLVSVAGCTLDRDACCIRTERARVALTGRELALLQLLFDNVGRPVTRQRLASEVWGGQAEQTGHTMEQHIYQVRRKLRQCVGKLLSVRSIYGNGYRLDLLVSRPPLSAPASCTV